MQDWVNITNGNLIAVNIQYRLGLLGYLASSEIMSDGTANAGQYDQRAAFEWVQRHISEFGGDPNHVTISVRPWVDNAESRANLRGAAAC